MNRSVLSRHPGFSHAEFSSPARLLNWRSTGRNLARLSPSTRDLTIYTSGGHDLSVGKNGGCGDWLSATASELTRVLGYSKFHLSAEERQELLANCIPYCEIVESTTSCPQTCRDTKDQPFLDLAHSAGAESLATGDSDLLVLSGQTDFIESPDCGSWLLSRYALIRVAASAGKLIQKYADGGGQVTASISMDFPSCLIQFAESFQVRGLRQTLRDRVVIGAL